MNTTKSYSRIYIYLYTLCYSFLLLFVYNLLGFQFDIKHNNGDIFMFIFIFILIFIPLFFIPLNISRPSFLFQWMFYLLVYIPTNISAYYSLDIKEINIVLFLLSFCISFLILFIFNDHSFRKVNVHYSFPFWTFFWLIYICFTVLSIYIFGFHLKINLDIRETYTIREDFKDAATGSSAMIIGWLEYVMNPFLIAWGILRGKKYIIALGIIGELYIYATTGLKTAFILPLPIIILTFFFKNQIHNKKNINIPIVILKLTIVFIAFCLITDYIFFKDSILYKYFLTNVFVRRSILTPGFLTIKYVEYFNFHTKVFLDNSSLFNKLFINQKSHNIPIPYIIGQYISGSDSMCANANFLADAYANFGSIGMIIYSFIVSFFLFMFDKFSGAKNVISFVLVFSISYFLSNSSIIVSFIGHGGLFALSLMIFYRYNKNNKYEF